MKDRRQFLNFLRFGKTDNMDSGNKFNLAKKIAIFTLVEMGKGTIWWEVNILLLKPTLLEKWTRKLKVTR